MKQIHLFISFIALLLFSSCEIVDISQEKRISCPDLSKSAQGINISLKNPSSDVLYANIYRQDITGVADLNKATTKIYNIGIVFPDESTSTLIYEDIYIYKGRKYRYYMRLYDKIDGYTLTEWTDSITVSNGISDNQKTISYGVSKDTKFIYDKLNKTIKVSGTFVKPTGINDFDKTFQPAIVFSSNNGTIAVKIDSLDKDKIHYLSNLLPIDFQNTEVQVLGIVAQKEEKNTDKIVNRVIWTPITSVSLYDLNGITISNNKITIQNQYGDGGYDYSSDY